MKEFGFRPPIQGSVKLIAKALCGPTALGSSTEFFNAYAHSGYLNSIFVSDTHLHMNANANNQTYDNNVLNYSRNNFYMSVRCVRNKALQPDEKK